MKTKGKIAIFHCGFIYSGGGERIVLEQAKGLIKRGWEVDVFAPTLEARKCFPEQIKELKVKTLFPQLPSWFPYRHAISMIATCVFVPVLVPKFNKYNVYIGANQPGAWIAYVFSIILNKKYLVYLNQPNRLIYPRKIDIECGYQTEKSYYLLNIILKKIEPFVAWADKISITHPESLLANGNYIGGIIKKVYKKNIIDCPAGADQKQFSSLRLNPHTAYEGSFKIKNISGKTIKIKKPYILITNRHYSQKKFEYVILAMVKVLNEFPNTTLVIPGSFTTHTPNLVKMARKLEIIDKIIFTKQINERYLQKLYREAAVYCYPAPEEDFGMGIMESAAWGVPSVAWNHAGPTVTIKNNKTGFLIKPNNISGYADKIIYLLKNQKKRANMGSAAWKRMGESFSWKNHLDIIEKQLIQIT